MNDDTTKINEDYRRILATANKLETIQSNLESVIDFFLTPIVKLYTKLCNDCMKLLFECDFKLDHFRKAEELVWRRIYHDIYRFQKTKRQRVKRHDESLMESHFISGIGFYSSLIVKLRTHYKIYNVKGMIEPLSLTLGPLDNFVVNQRLNEGDEEEKKKYNDEIADDVETNDDNSMSIDKEHDPNLDMAREWARQAIYRSLVYMGDLARYLLETSQFDYKKLAFEFYRSASRNQPDHGLPFNQLATLAGGLNHNLGAVCNYMRCCLRPKPFEGAEGNMRKIFDLNQKFYDEISSVEQVCKISDVLSSKEPSLAAESMMRALVVTFIKLTSDLWTTITGGDSDQLLKDVIVEETRKFFEILLEALELEPIVPLVTTSSFEQEFCPISGGSSFDNKPKYVSPTIMYEFCSVSIMLIAKCQKKQSLVNPNATELVSDYIIDLVNTLALNLFHYSTLKCQKMILSKVQEVRVSRHEHGLIDKRFCTKPASEMSLKNYGGNLSNSQRSSETINSLSEATSRRAMSRLRQRKAATNYSDSNNRLKSLVHTEDSDMSELEETALSTIDALEISSDMSEEAEYQINDLIDLESSSDENSGTNQRHNWRPPTVGSFNNLSKPILRPTRSQNYELERSMYLADSSNSLPVPDLLTGDITDRMNFKISATSQSPLESPSGLDERERSSPSGLDKDTSRLNEINELELVLSFVYTQTYLPTIKIFCDWLLSNGEIISSNLQSFHSFCEELDKLVSFLKDLRKLADSKDTDSTTAGMINLDTSLFASNNDQHDDSLVLKHTFDGSTWVQKYPLDCDFPLLNLDPLKNVHELNIDFNYHKDLGDHEAGFVTIQCIEAFHHALTAFLKNKAFQ